MRRSASSHAPAGRNAEPPTAHERRAGVERWRGKHDDIAAGGGRVRGPEDPQRVRGVDMRRKLEKTSRVARRYTRPRPQRASQLATAAGLTARPTVEQLERRQMLFSL